MKKQPFLHNTQLLHCRFEYRMFHMMLWGLLFLVFSSQANNLWVGNVSLSGENSSQGYTQVNFDISWDNSWRTDDLNGDGITNWDATWIFVKFRLSEGAWQHAFLNQDGHSTGSGTPMGLSIGLRDDVAAFQATTNPVLGVFVYRSSNGEGANTVNGMQLRWNYASNGVLSTDKVDIRVFAVEMVYVPGGDFYLGSGGSDSWGFYAGGASITTPFLVSSSTFSFENSTGNLWARNVGTSSSGSLATGFPTGNTPFYCMKYEISQQQYVDFLNTLTQPQADNRKYTYSSYRYGITGGSAEAYESSYPYVACNCLSWMDGAAYADWAGLRPMSELEYEKSCRGGVSPIANEFAWGTTQVASLMYSLNNIGLLNEGISTNYSTTQGNASYATTNSNINGPLRVGLFAANPSNTNRITSGASYYGIMELSGNLDDWCVTCENVEGRAFNGNNGDGELSSTGAANEATWPGLSSGEVVGADGVGIRGGDWTDQSSLMEISDRSYAVYAFTGNYVYMGFRAVRSAP